MQTASFMIWTRVVAPISYDDSHITPYSSIWHLWFILKAWTAEREKSNSIDCNRFSKWLEAAKWKWRHVVLYKVATRKWFSCFESQHSRYWLRANTNMQLSTPPGSLKELLHINISPNNFRQKLELFQRNLCVIRNSRLIHTENVTKRFYINILKAFSFILAKTEVHPVGGA